jgi:hypothetical protein
MAIAHSRPPIAGGSLLALLHPRGQTRLVAGLLAAGLPAAWLGVTQLRLPLWGTAAAVVGLLAYPAARKWRQDRRQLGAPAMALSILLVTQSLHTVEHLAQWVQYYVLAWPLKASSGLISPLNAEIVHFSWNLAVLLVVIWLVESGPRNRWMWLLLLWAGAHTAEHTYMFVNYVQEIQRLASEGLPLNAAQGLPGFFGRNGWLAANAPAAGPVAWLCQIAPALTSAPRLDVHFWWNLGEIGLLFAAAHTSMSRHSEP